MASRCSKCNRLKLLGRGWVSKLDKIYCPTCWAELLAREEARKREEEAKRKRAQEESRKEAERKRAQLRSQIDEIRRQLEVYSSGQAKIRAEFSAPSIALAQYALKRMDWVLRQVSGKGVEELKSNFEAYVEPVTLPVTDVLNRTKSQETIASVNDLIQLCLQLTKFQNERLNYADGIKFPVDILTHLGEIDRTTTLELLCKTACDRKADDNVRSVSVIALGRIGDQQALEPLLDILEEAEVYQGWISNVACALIDLGDKQAVMPIIRGIEQNFCTGNYGEWTARDYIAERMASLIPPETDLYQEVCSAWRAAKETAKARELGPKAVASVLERVLVDCGGHEAVEIAAEWAQSQDKGEALKGTNALANLDYEEALDALYSIVTTSRRIIVGYHDSGDMEGIPDYAPNTEQRIVAAKVLAKRGGPKAMAAFQIAASDKDTQVRKVIGRLLSDL